MREILFRGKAKTITPTYEPEGSWVYGFYSNFDDRAVIERKQDDCLVDKNTIGQFTGLTDKNGKKIFEGDIVKFTDTTFGFSHIGFVCFYKGSFCIQYKYFIGDIFHQIGKTDKWQDMGASGIITYEYEIIGNIHDNPELLKNGETNKN